MGMKNFLFITLETGHCHYVCHIYRDGKTGKMQASQKSERLKRPSYQTKRGIGTKVLEMWVWPVRRLLR